MFVEQAKVLGYRQQFEAELGIVFSDSTNTETSRKLVFSLTCVCVVCVCLSARKSLRVDILGTS